MEDKSKQVALLKTSESDIKTWVVNNPFKLSYSDVCKKFGVDIENDRRNAFFWNIMITAKLVIGEELLDWCGYSGEYKNKKKSFLHLLNKNPHITYTEIEDEHYKKKRYLIVDPLDFESLLMQMRSKKAQEIRDIYSFLKHISIQYTKYEKYYEKHQSQLLTAQNIVLTQSVGELKELVLQVKSNSDGEIERAERERQKADEERENAKKKRQQAEKERQQADKERQQAEEARQRAEEARREAEKAHRCAEKRHVEVSEKLTTITKRIRVEVVDRLKTEIAPLVAPAPINANKVRCLALLVMLEGTEWYIVRRQHESFNKAINAVLRKNPAARLVKTWRGVAHAVDIGNCVKLRLRGLKWSARGNTLRVDSLFEEELTYTDAHLVKTIEIILADNAAIKLSEFTNIIIN